MPLTSKIYKKNLPCSGFLGLILLGRARILHHACKGTSIFFTIVCHFYISDQHCYLELLLEWRAWKKNNHSHKELCLIVYQWLIIFCLYYCFVSRVVILSIRGPAEYEKQGTKVLSNQITSKGNMSIHHNEIKNVDNNYNF